MASTGFVCDGSTIRFHFGLYKLKHFNLDLIFLTKSTNQTVSTPHLFNLPLCSFLWLINIRYCCQFYDAHLIGHPSLFCFRWAPKPMGSHGLLCNGYLHHYFLKFLHPGGRLSYSYWDHWFFWLASLKTVVISNMKTNLLVVVSRNIFVFCILQYHPLFLALKFALKEWYLLLWALKLCLIYLGLFALVSKVVL